MFGCSLRGLSFVPSYFHSLFLLVPSTAFFDEFEPPLPPSKKRLWSRKTPRDPSGFTCFVLKLPRWPRRHVLGKRGGDATYFDSEEIHVLFLKLCIFVVRLPFSLGILVGRRERNHERKYAVTFSITEHLTGRTLRSRDSLTRNTEGFLRGSTGHVSMIQVVGLWLAERRSNTILVVV